MNEFFTLSALHAAIDCFFQDVMHSWRMYSCHVILWSREQSSHNYNAMGNITL